MSQNKPSGTKPKQKEGMKEEEEDIKDSNDKPWWHMPFVPTLGGRGGWILRPAWSIVSSRIARTT